jgi:hypothetical protein
VGPRAPGTQLYRSWGRPQSNTVTGKAFCHCRESNCSRSAVQPVAERMNASRKSALYATCCGRPSEDQSSPLLVPTARTVLHWMEAALLNPILKLNGICLDEGHPLSREDGSPLHLYNCFWALPKSHSRLRFHTYQSE